MLRDKNLVSFSHQHQHALGLCVRIIRALESEEKGLRFWQAEIRAAFDSEIEVHFEAEEQILFPAAMQFEDLRKLVSELAAEHIVLRSYNLAATALSLGPRELSDFASTLSSHIRKEEQQLFERMQQLLSEEELRQIGNSSEAFFRSRGSTAI